MTSTFDEEVAHELAWLRRHPEFEERPASIEDFLGPRYLNIDTFVRPKVREILIDIFGVETNATRIANYERAIFTGAIGIGKTTLASIVLPYMAHWVLCLKDPQTYFGLMPGTRIAFMQMSTSAPQAKEVVFGDVKARIENSPWFKTRYPMDPKFTNQIRFSKEIWVLPGDSAETTFEGYNILGGILDEGDSHKITKTKDYAEQGYTTITGRVTSRFMDRGFVLVIGQMKKAAGFMAKMYKDMMSDPKAYVARLTIWESLGWYRWTNEDGTRDSFWYDAQKLQFVAPGFAELMGYPRHIIEVPNFYKRQFQMSPVKALRDLAGMPMAAQHPFVHDVQKIIIAQNSYKQRYGNGPLDERNRFADDPGAGGLWRAYDSLKRVVGVDIAYSAEGDALGLVMGHSPEMVQVDDEWKPLIVIDLVMRIKAPPGGQIILGDVRRIIFDLKVRRKFRIVKLTTDGFESTDFRQQVEKKRIHTEVISVDKSKLPYQDLYDALMEERILIPPYLVYLNVGDDALTDIVFKELSELEELDNKIDHPPDGSKDVADAMAAVAHMLIGTRNFQNRGGRAPATREIDAPSAPDKQTMSNPAFRHPAVIHSPHGRVPVPDLDGRTLWRPPVRGR